MSRGTSETTTSRPGTHRPLRHHQREHRLARRNGVDSRVRRLVRSHRESQTQMAAELHDTVVQALVAVHLWLESAIDDESLPPQSRWDMTELLVGVDEAIIAGRALLEGLKPDASAVERLGDAIREQVENASRTAGLDARVDVSGDLEEAPADVKNALYRMVRESLLNVLRHAGASRVSVRLSRSDDALEAEIEDDGKGFDTAILAANEGNFGLSSFRERAELMGGRTEVRSQPSRGTRVMVSLPLENRVRT